MQTNDTNGHQHEVSEKRLAPGAFPYRLDMEIRAWGTRQWVDQNGTPATPWRFINLGPSLGEMRAPRWCYGPLPSQRWTG